MAMAAESIDEDQDTGAGGGPSADAATSASASRPFSEHDLMAPTMAPTASDRPPASTAAAADDDEDAIDPAITAWLGQTIDGRYKIVEVLGEGGMGAVFVAENLNLRKQVALKVIRREYAGDPEIAARFTREAMATASLDHPHVASALDFGLLPDGSAFLVIQLVRGRSLSKLLGEQALAWPQACDIVAQIADALAAAHGAGIVHRDLKPDNVLLERRDDGRYHVKVLDFGIARVAEEGGPQGGRSGGVVTRMGVVMGTPGYMSPEQAIGERVDHRTDLYALGVVLWECITGRPLWVAESLTELVSRQLSEAAPPIVTITGMSVPELLEQLIAQLLARRPEGRPESAATIRDALRKLAAGGDGSETAASTTGFSFGRRTEVAPATAYSTLITPGASPWLRARAIAVQTLRDPRRRMIVAAAAAGLVLFVAIAAMVGGDDEGRGDDGAQASADAAGEPGVAVGAAPAGAAKTKADDVTPAATTQRAGAGKGAAAPGAGKGAPPTQSMIEGASAAIQTSAEVQALIDAVLGEATAAKRKTAAKELKERAKKSELIPTFATLCADLELARGCTAKKKIIAAIEAEGDARALPALERLAESPKQGCGFLKMGDCLECARRPLAAAIKALGEAAP